MLFFFFFDNFISLFDCAGSFVAMRAFSLVEVVRGYPLLAAHGFLIEAACLVAQHSLQSNRAQKLRLQAPEPKLSSYGMRASPSCRM